MAVCLQRGANDLHMVQLMPMTPHEAKKYCHCHSYQRLCQQLTLIFKFFHHVTDQ